MEFVFYEIQTDYFYEWKDKIIIIEKGTLFFAAKNLPVENPGLIDYQIVLGNKRIWFKRSDVEKNNLLFKKVDW